MQLSDSAKSPPAAPVPLPAIAVSIADGLATVILEPHTAEMSEEVKTSLLNADRVRIFIDARNNAHLSRPACGPVKAADYPADTLAFLVHHADLICAGVVDCPDDASPDEIEKILAAFDSEEVEDCRWAIRLFTDEPSSWGEHIEMYRPRHAVCLTAPIYESEPTAG
jgi:hypothetical protein